MHRGEVGKGGREKGATIPYLLSSITSGSGGGPVVEPPPFCPLEEEATEPFPSCSAVLPPAPEATEEEEEAAPFFLAAALISFNCFCSCRVSAFTCTA